MFTRSTFLKSFVLVLVLQLVVSCNSTEPIVKHVSVTGKSVENIVELMTLAEKVGQMTQADRRYLIDEADITNLHLGSLLSGGGSTPETNNPSSWADMVDRYQDLAAKSRLGIPLMYGIDAVHGHSNVVGATIFPHNIALGATGNPGLVREIAHITAKEVRATGINWTFDPCVANSRDERWGRAYESYGEDPALLAALGQAQVEGYQGASLSDADAIVACTKHYIGDGAPTWTTGKNGKIDRGDAQISEDELRALHLPPYQAAIQGGTATIMASYNSWNGEKLHGQKYLMTDVLKGELGFQGFIVTDWAGIDELPGDYKSDIVESINAGVDMIMVPGDTSKDGYTYREFITKLIEAANEGLIEMSRIDDAVTRILNVKKSMGLLDAPYHNDRNLIPHVGSSEHRAVARQAVRESVVLLRNESVLPLSKDIATIVVAGRGANDVGMQCGGWTISWQGGMGDITPGTTVLDGVQAMVSSSTQVVHSPDGTIVSNADAVIVVVGETPYAEMHGDRDNLVLSNEDIEVINTVKASGKPMVVVLLSGRPIIITDIIEEADAFLAAWLPGTEGNGITDVIFGDYSPTGKLSVTWPTDMSQIPINVGDSNYAPLFPVGYGLTY
ncbi:MAG: beta-glucosidase [Candidatus Marinimicrobia bacterium]|jgi:beta-glucosidase|nr:beta-glucosidase [Candidatus Neomarinimicrobiota bacterium]MBT3576573.1 beta-glucosidase [Candidatus Neomarinimicrobiota bacterium]MBT3680179.1 beta-glucosidase [Candidatus Neomarinimicrobiota bacterium]MBT3949826.1 beta-glucosidase [Candidatus Neomarinimicrobiota bacterium]MBT4253548.1 beta-glucosidase [Candidatus Neomarinimicrobiota bacterium]